MSATVKAGHINALTVLSDCLPMSDSGFTPSDVGRALGAVDELIAAAKQMNRLAKGPAGGVSQADKRAIVVRMDKALAAFGGGA
jgi:hypothetical protein